ncbi:SGNH/GDSL hydrolase family protein [Paraburkholderia caballeronis]|uniref:SGNH/GDSL hydrolase family protein n=1 Tax=Paraburkholderia caballeronis TaxID=416943 RepID=UPI0010663BE5|nr:SGNH/GDSL hydrolase family protein [Paraburkholderia caballeronis]TDV08362.1 phospholipase/lecithinase/hemolysin [Paraburkholderia caballeronis]TDV12054.1 phospholipase/lecithinase/hemolysin [Paraburkholderia caballeronis]TDV22675.1 phospholipase/lecithinase/hemolysin [Paraburkholderia caballeronis]TDV35159.1 phospholipase/lecithinase/hemolysin [Paraburkholderia caballeronis]
MKQRATTHRKLLRTTQIAIASAAFALLAACGGGGGDNNNASNTPAGGVTLQVVSFGDSLSDVGTYTPNILPGFGGGKFTTNPGEIWVQKIAEYYGGTISPAYEGGFGLPLTATGGLGYAQGGSDVSAANPQGMGWLPNNAAATTVPVETQIGNYLSAHGSFNANQLVLVNGGANDIFQFSTAQNLTALATALQTGFPQAVAAQQVPNTPAGQVQFIAGYLQSNNTQVAQAAVALATQIQKIVSSGATHVVLMTVPDIGQTPQGVTADAQQAGTAAVLTGVTAAYNGMVEQLIQPLIQSGQVIVADAFTWLDTVALPNYQAEGFTVSNTGTACNLQSMQASATQYAQQHPEVLAGGITAEQYGSQFASSLFCSPQTYTTANADQTYMFADLVHPSTHMHALFAQYVEQTIAKTGLGK